MDDSGIGDVISGPGLKGDDILGLIIIVLLTLIVGIYFIVTSLSWVFGDKLEPGSVFTKTEVSLNVKSLFKNKSPVVIKKYKVVHIDKSDDDYIILEDMSTGERKRESIDVLKDEYKHVPKKE
jgi:3D (Asp-Asp-Asp) domain-containing protein